MKVQLNSPITESAVTRSGGPGQALQGGAAGGSSAARSETADGIRISGTSVALSESSTKRQAGIDQLTSVVQGGSYQTSSRATSQALVKDALAGEN
jgi:hypothetical protein